MTFNKCLIAAAIAFGLTVNLAHAQNDIPKTDVSAKTESAKAVGINKEPLSSSVDLKKAQDQLATSFNGMSVTGFHESPIPGVYEVKTGGNIIYFHPGEDGKKGVLLFGEMYDSTGSNLTALSKMGSLSDTLKSVPLDTAITIGPKNAPIFYEFTDPDCPYCHAYDQWIKEYSKTHPVQRKLIFMVNPGHPLARAKIEHVICSKDKDEAVRYVYSEELPHNPDSADAMQMAKQKALKTCKEADQVIAEHDKVLKAVGVNGTPSFLFNVDTKPNLIVGFNQQKIADAITELEKPAVTKVDKSSTK